MTKDQFYIQLDDNFDQRKTPKEIMEWLIATYEETNDADEDVEVHIACTSELAAFCRAVSDFDGSVGYFREVLQLLKAFSGELTMEYAVTVNNLAGTHRQMGEMEKAEELFLKAKDLMENRHEEEHYFYASVLNNLALLCMDSQRGEEGLVLMEQSMEVLKRLGGHEEDIATGLLNQAYYYAGISQRDEAMNRLLRAMEMFAALPYINPHEISAKMLYGQLLSQGGKPEEAEKWLLQVLEEIEATFGKNKDYYTTLRSLATHYRKNNQDEEADVVENQIREGKEQ